MELVEAYTNIREMTPGVLLHLTQSLKYQQVRRSFTNDIGTHDRLVVTQQDIEDMGEALKLIVFFISPCIIRDTIKLARDKSVLGVEFNWLKTT